MLSSKVSGTYDEYIMVIIKKVLDFDIIKWHRYSIFIPYF